MISAGRYDRGIDERFCIVLFLIEKLFKKKNRELTDEKIVSDIIFMEIITMSINDVKFHTIYQNENRINLT